MNSVSWYNDAGGPGGVNTPTMQSYNPFRFTSDIRKLIHDLTTLTNSKAKDKKTSRVYTLSHKEKLKCANPSAFISGRRALRGKCCKKKGKRVMWLLDFNNKKRNEKKNGMKNTK